MITKHILLFKEWHNESRLSLRYFNSFEEATRAAGQMLDQFRYWGGGSVPVNVSSDRWTKSGKYKDTLHYIEYPERLWKEYARENGNKCGYLQEQKRR